MDKVTEITNKIEDEAALFEDKAKKLNAKLDAEADKGIDAVEQVLEAGKKSQFTGAFLLLVLVGLFVGGIWLIVR